MDAKDGRGAENKLNSDGRTGRKRFITRVTHFLVIA